MSFALTMRERRWLTLGLACLILVRIATLGFYPLMDPTEGRYAEIARKMLAGGDWIMPQFDYGVPFWGKPPLSIWLSAASMAVFGVNEFAARFPSFLLLFLCGALVGWLAVKRGNSDQALWSVSVFAATGLVFVAAGSVMTDPALTLGTTCSMAGFWMAVNCPEGRHRIAQVIFFAGLAIGLLAKGPIALILTVLPIGVWVVWTRRWRKSWEKIPWVIGLAMTALLVAPWYWLAERESPGFLNYFLMGEHWKRFTEAGWRGDLYGAAHARPRGTIWLQWIAAALPWSLFFVAWIATATWRWKRTKSNAKFDSWTVYLMLWSVAPMLFFTVSGNVLVTYVLPGLPGLALLVADRWRPRDSDPREFRPSAKVLLAVVTLVPFVFIGIVVSQQQRFEMTLSQKALVRDYQAGRGNSSARLIYVSPRPMSAQFYARGATLHVSDPSALAPYLQDELSDFVAVRQSDLAGMTEATHQRLVPVGEYGRFLLLREPTP